MHSYIGRAPSLTSFLYIVFSCLTKKIKVDYWPWRNSYISWNCWQFFQNASHSISTKNYVNGLHELGKAKRKHLSTHATNCTVLNFSWRDQLAWLTYSPVLPFLFTNKIRAQSLIWSTFLFYISLSQISFFSLHHIETWGSAVKKNRSFIFPCVS